MRVLFESGDYFIQQFQRCSDYSRAVLVSQAIPHIRGKEGMVNACTMSCSVIRYCIQSDSVVLILDVMSFVWWPTKHCMFTRPMAKSSRDLNSRLPAASPGKVCMMVATCLFLSLDNVASCCYTLLPFQ